MAGTILFVDDEIEMCYMMSNYFRYSGFDILTAENAEQTLNLAGGTTPLDVIILDVNLAGENGLKLMTFLKRNYPDVPIIIYTGMQHDDETVKKALAEGAHQYLRKGNPLDELLKAVQAVMKK